MRVSRRGGRTRRVLHSGIVVGSWLEDTSDGIEAPSESVSDQRLVIVPRSARSATEAFLLLDDRDDGQDTHSPRTL